MMFKWRYEAPEGFDDILMCSDGDVLTGLSFACSSGLEERIRDFRERKLPVFRETCRWLDCYFGGEHPDFSPQYSILGSTPFRDEVLCELVKIPYGTTTTYGKIAAAIARRHGNGKMSAQAVGGAVGWNPIGIIIPCHRVIGADGSPTGYGGGMRNKMALLRLEGSTSCKSSLVGRTRSAK